MTAGFTLSFTNRRWEDNQLIYQLMWAGVNWVWLCDLPELSLYDKTNEAQKRNVLFSCVSECSLRILCSSLIFTFLHHKYALQIPLFDTVVLYDVNDILCLCCSSRFSHFVLLNTLMHVCHVGEALMSMRRPRGSSVGRGGGGGAKKIEVLKHYISTYLHEYSWNTWH